ncbi:liprin-beta-2b isoform X5 [Osmerus eperlanus]|uniref:liprin-beta-2b isoform X5 n=1 Tax=Osmerus eperlanus TaxID=29151 RepID=UPI002E0DC50B
MESDASHMLEAALEQMDDIIAGSKAAAEYSNGLLDLGSPSSCISAGPLQVLQLAEELRLALELQASQEDRASLRAQVSSTTAHTLLLWLDNGEVNLRSPGNNETYQERLVRLEGDKESLVLQVSVLTDQVEAQGEKIRDLETSLEEHHHKLLSTEEMLQQELLSRTSLESQKLDLMDEVSYLKLQLVNDEQNHQPACDVSHNKAECVVNLISDLQEEMCRFQEEINTRIQEKRALEEAQGEMAARQAHDQSPDVGLGGSDTGLGAWDLDDCCRCGGEHGLLQELRQLKSKVDELEGEKTQYERKLKATKLSISYSLHVCYQSLMTKLSSLKLTVEHTQVEKQHWEERWRAAQAEISDLQQLLASKDTEIQSLQSQLLSRPSSSHDTSDKEEMYRQLLDKYQEFHRLKMGMESLLASNEEKDRHIEELTVLLGQYRKMKEVLALTQGGERTLALTQGGERTLALTQGGERALALTQGGERTLALTQGGERTLALTQGGERTLALTQGGERALALTQGGERALALTQAEERMLSGSSEEELSRSLVLRVLTHKAHCDVIRTEMSSQGSSPLFVSPPSFQRELDSSCRSFQTSMEMSLVSPGDGGYHSTAWSRPRMLSSSLEELQSGSLPKHEAEPVHLVPDSENLPQEMNKYQTLPGKLSRREVNGQREKYSPVQLSPVESDDNDYNLRRPEGLGEALLSDLSPLSSGMDSGQHSPVSPENRKSTRGIRKLWGKIRRSQSGSMPGEAPDMGEFRRGGFRATAGPRLARAKDALSLLRDQKTPFSRWTTDQVCDWLSESGLGQYVQLARHWVTSGQTLLSATPQDLEKELGIKNPLHRKKVQLAVKSLSTRQAEKSSELDHVWVTRWLDDIGLPQYKDQFHESRVDGRVLQYLTVNDLLFLKVTSQLHHLSIKCAIHVLHVNKFDPHCLKRRPGDENKTSPSEVVQWSNHRVMEWLRSVDLAEYAPNLRGSGVHGGLIILEPRFNSDTLAMLLNIPPQKTLLRRHLGTNFSSLVGSSAQLEKRDYLEATGHSPLSTTAKVKPKKLGFSTLRRRKADDSTDYICPLESQAQANGSQRPYAGFRGLSPILDRDPDRREQVVITEGTVLQIEALSDGINNLTYLLSRDQVVKERRRTQTALV